MEKIFELIRTALAALGIDTDGTPWVGYISKAFTSASENGSASIQLPQNSRGWRVIGFFAVATAMDFYVDISRSKNENHLTSGLVPADLCMTDPADSSGRSMIPPWEADGNETITFSLQNGATASNTVKLAVIARRK